MITAFKERTGPRASSIISLKLRANGQSSPQHAGSSLTFASFVPSCNRSTGHRQRLGRPIFRASQVGRTATGSMSLASTKLTVLK
eukprot:SAG22_NODE_5780_length_953_cov_1.402810_2_plen_85_part_00